MQHQPLALAWSGGKDSMLALHFLWKQSAQVAALITTVSGGFGDCERISAHGVRRELLEAQAEALGLSVELVRVAPASSNVQYEASFGAALEELKARGIANVAAGDLFLKDVRNYREALFQRLGMSAQFPLWQLDTTWLTKEFIQLGFEAVLTCVDTHALDASFVGRTFDSQLLQDLPAGTDPCGENGEFHTFVRNGPGFARRVDFERGEIVCDERFAFCDLLPV